MFTKVVKDNSRGKSKRRYSVLNKAAATIDTKKDITKILSLPESIELMSGGRDVTLYYVDATNGEYASRRACLFYNDGIFYWSAEGINKKTRSTKSLPLSSITDIYLGKSTDVFESKIATNEDKKLLIIHFT